MEPPQIEPFSVNTATTNLTGTFTSSFTVPFSPTWEVTTEITVTAYLTGWTQWDDSPFWVLPLGEPVTFTNVISGDTGFDVEGPAYVVVTSQEEWDELLETGEEEAFDLGSLIERILPLFGEEEEPPQIDWEEEIILGAFSEPQIPSGHQIRIRAIAWDGERARVAVQERSPALTLLSWLSSFHQPYHLVAVSRSALPSGTVAFQFQDVTGSHLTTVIKDL